MAEELKINIIPKPAFQHNMSGKFVINNQTQIFADEKCMKIALKLADLIEPTMGYKLKKIPFNQTQHYVNAITLFIDNDLDILSKEGYNLLITEACIILRANDVTGIFYGFQTIRQLLQNEIENHSKDEKIELSVPCLEIEDEPQYIWRGLMLDEARHFQGMDEVKKILDIMAMLKMNILHWGLSNDQGWRIEIKKYPKLAEIGSIRYGTQLGGLTSKQVVDGIHSGFYTQEQIKEIVEYAKERYITIVPEVNSPGHALAAIASYPELSCTGGPFEVSKTFGIKKDVYCIGKELVFEFIQNVFDELIALFPGPYIHIGGDECPRTRWKSCPNCQKRIKDEKLKSVNELQPYYTNRISKYLQSKGKTVIGWNEILSDKLDEHIIGQYWQRNRDKIFKHLLQGRKFIMSKFGFVYLDYNYFLTPLYKTYNYEPVMTKFKSLPTEKYNNVLGVEATMWTEWVPNIKRLEWQLFPRLIAVAEVGWTLKSLKNYADFKERLKELLKRLDIIGVNYAKLDIVDPKKFKRIFKLLRINILDTHGGL